MATEATPKPKVHLRDLILDRSICGLKKPKETADVGSKLTCKTCKKWYADPKNKKFYTGIKRKATAAAK